MQTIKIISLLLFILPMGASAAGPVFMSSEWGKVACDSWNASSTLTEALAGENWAANNGGKGHKILHLYRLDCSDSPTAELRIADQKNAAICTYGGAVASGNLNNKHDYIMFAKTKNWSRMGSGKDGAMKAMMFGRLKFQGPKWEAMNNMGPFGAFLRLTGEVASDTKVCP